MRQACERMQCLTPAATVVEEEKGNRVLVGENGFDLGLTRAISDAVDIPIIASGGVGELKHLAEGVTIGRADAVLAASIFHFGEYSIQQAKQYMTEQGIEMRYDNA